MTTLTFDSYAWIAYLKGETKKIEGIVSSDAKIMTPAVVITEVKHKCLRENYADAVEDVLEFIESRSMIIDINKTIASQAADLKIKHGLYTIDAIIYATALENGTKLVSGDEHLKGLPDVVTIKEDK
ncbi:MAG: hypothetical protein MSIBF_05930 [Candidatus Altiarchaeales archaeon IMC4]|nr:MAG: hypothetical protein MSIBF_05930 [Candidatus Altiarchaeales archaeon IMC4]